MIKLFKKIEIFTFLLILSVSGRDEPFILGADISWIDQRENEGVKYADSGKIMDPFEIFKNHSFNYIRLRLFVDPTAIVEGCSESPYSTKGFCNLEHTRKMAKRIKNAGMKFLLDFHYSDVWADPAKQYKPVSWNKLNLEQLKDTVRNYTKEVLLTLKQDGTLPDMVQIGNEIVGGMIWPDGRISNMSNFATLVNAGIDGVKEVSNDIKIMIHSISENSPSNWLKNIINAGVKRIDVFGLSYYSKWHGTPYDLQRMLNEVAKNHNIKICVVEYADNHKTVNELVYSLPDEKGIGTFVWEPQEFGDSTLFDWRNGRRETNKRIDLYIELNNKYNTPISTITPISTFETGSKLPNYLPSYIVNLKGCKFVYESKKSPASYLSSGYYIFTRDRTFYGNHLVER